MKLPNEKEQKVDVVESPFEKKESHYSQDMYDDQLKYFAQCIEKKQTPVPGGLEGMMNMKVVDAAYESSKTGKVVSIK